MSGMTLVEFLRARLDEDEQVARAAMPGPWRWSTDGAFLGETSSTSDWTWGHCGPDLLAANGEDVLTSTGYDADNVVVLRADAEHIARHDPARVLAEVAAKRALIAAVDADKDPFDALGAESAYESLVCEHLALPYAGHPDYREEWKP
jgi:hypothetical protein